MDIRKINYKQKAKIFFVLSIIVFILGAVGTDSYVAMAGISLTLPAFYCVAKLKMKTKNAILFSILGILFAGLLLYFGIDMIYNKYSITNGFTTVSLVPTGIWMSVIGVAVAILVIKYWFKDKKLQ